MTASDFSLCDEGFNRLRRALERGRTSVTATSGNGGGSKDWLGAGSIALLWMAIRGDHPCRETVIWYLGTTVPSAVRVQEHRAARAAIVQIVRRLSIGVLGGRIWQ